MNSEGSTRHHAITLLPFFVGAGVSALSGTPTWKSLTDEMCQRMCRKTKESYSADEFLQIPQMFFYSLDENEDKYYDFIEQHLNHRQFKPNALHKELFHLNPACIITTNFDTLLEDAAVQHCQSFKTIACDREVPSIIGDRFILKVHGDIKHRNIVLKEEDYLSYSENFKLLETLLKSIFSTNTVVFVGYSLNDYNIKLILNWAKTLLAGDFNKPIFIYTGDNSLTPEDLRYQESKGLCVIEYEKVGERSDTYPPRYFSVINAIKKTSSLTYEGKTEQEALDVTYELLKPLDRLNALRIKDINEKLSPHAKALCNGQIVKPPKQAPALDYFVKLSKLSHEEYSTLDEGTKVKYGLILRVLKKARVNTLVEEGGDSDFVKANIPLGDLYCIAFDYQKMQNKVKMEARTIEEKYCNAYYLARMRKHYEAFCLFAEVATKSFEKREYLLYYLSEVNCTILCNVMKNLNVFYESYDIERIDDMLFEDDTESIFRKLPIEVQNQYKSLNNLHSATLLYEYSYQAFSDGEKLKNKTESGAVEYGLTSLDNVVCRINESLHFFPGNHLIIDWSSEYKNTVKNLMSLLVQKYSEQGSSVLHEWLDADVVPNTISFDALSFYCFIEFFASKELIKLFSKHSIDTIVFLEISMIETAVDNIINYYEVLMSQNSSGVEINFFQVQIKNCLTLLRYVNIHQPLVDKLTVFILKYDFHNIHIDDKIFFFDRQIVHRKMHSDITQKAIENKLIEYIDLHINALGGGLPFECYSAHRNICYGDLVRYIAPGSKSVHSRRLTLRISRIVDENIEALFPYVIRCYSDYLSNYQRPRIVSWAKERLLNDFHMDLLVMLINCKARLDSDIILSLKNHLNKTMPKNGKQPEHPGVKLFPSTDPYEELIRVGYYCLTGVLPKVFADFIGYSDMFDFFYLYQKFDFKKFQPAWLIKLNIRALERIAKSKRVRLQIRLAVTKEMTKKKIVSQDRTKLQIILTRYFY